MPTQGMIVGSCSPLSRGTSLLLGSCAVVATAAILGMDWLRSPVAGLPTGMWVIGLIQVQAWLLHRARGEVPVSMHELGEDSAAQPSSCARLLGRLAGAVWETARVCSKSLRIPGAWFREVEDRVSVRADRVLSSARPLRIGLDAGPDFRAAMISQPTGLDVEWVILSPGADDQATLRRHALDALVRASCTTPARPLRIVTLEHPERDGAWYDWSTPRPLTYASVFPVRVDPTQVTIDDADVADPAQSSLIASILRASAVLARSPGRLRLSDRLNGRLPAAGDAHGVRSPTSLLDRALLELTGTVIETASTRTPAARAAGRAVSAWLASTEAWLDINLRRRGIEAALCAIGPESEVMLRAAAVRLAMCEDDAAFEALREAEGLIRSGSHQQIGEHLAFLQAELELGSPNPLTLGRVASGICLVCASSPPDRVAFIRGDIMDDVRHSAWLVGRDQDRAVLGEVFKLMGADECHPGPWELRDAA